jgi:uncharacterized protein
MTPPLEPTDPGIGTHPSPPTVTAPEPFDPRPLDPRVRAVWWVAGGLGSLQALLPVVLVDALVHPLGPWRLTLLAAAACVLVTAVVPPIRYRRWRYALRERDLWIRHGLWRVTVSVIPYRRLQFVDTRQGPLDRLFGLAQLVVHTAALGTSGRVPGLDAREAERLRELLSHLEPDDAAV